MSESVVYLPNFSNFCKINQQRIQLHDSLKMLKSKNPQLFSDVVILSELRVRYSFGPLPKFFKLSPEIKRGSIAIFTYVYKSRAVKIFVFLILTYSLINLTCTFICWIPTSIFQIISMGINIYFPKGSHVTHRLV